MPRWPGGPVLTPQHRGHDNRNLNRVASGRREPPSRRDGWRLPRVGEPTARPRQSRTSKRERESQLGGYHNRPREGETIGAGQAPRLASIAPVRRRRGARVRDSVTSHGRRARSAGFRSDRRPRSLTSRLGRRTRGGTPPGKGRFDTSSPEDSGGEVSKLPRVRARRELASSPEGRDVVAAVSSSTARARLIASGERRRSGHGFEHGASSPHRQRGEVSQLPRVRARRELASSPEGRDVVAAMGSSTARALPGKLRAARGDPKGGEARHAAAGPSRVVSCDTSGIMWGLGLGRAGPSPRGHATSVLRGV